MILGQIEVYESLNCYTTGKGLLESKVYRGSHSFVSYCVYQVCRFQVILKTTTVWITQYQSFFITVNKEGIIILTLCFCCVEFRDIRMTLAR